MEPSEQRVVCVCVCVSCHGRLKRNEGHDRLRYADARSSAHAESQRWPNFHRDLLSPGPRQLGASVADRLWGGGWLSHKSSCAVMCLHICAPFVQVLLRKL